MNDNGLVGHIGRTLLADDGVPLSPATTAGLAGVWFRQQHSVSDQLVLANDPARQFPPCSLFAALHTPRFSIWT